MNAENLMNAIKSDQETLINLLLTSIERDQKLIKHYEEQIKQAEQTYDLNRVAEIKYELLPEVQHSLIRAKTSLQKILVESAFKIIKNL